MLLINKNFIVARSSCDGSSRAGHGRISLQCRNLSPGLSSKRQLPARAIKRRCFVKAAVSDDVVRPESTSTKSPLPGWRDAREELVQSGARSVNHIRAQQMASEEGFLVLDVRQENSYVANHIKGSINVPLFTAEPGKLSFKLLAFLLLPTIKGTEYNDSFAEQVMKKVQSKDSPILLVCDRGGDLETSEHYPEGARSSSLLAMWLLMKAGFTRVVHVRGGLRSTSNRAAAPPNQHDVWLLKAFFPNAEYGMYSTELMGVAFAIPFLFLGILAYPRLLEMYSDYAYGLMN